MGVPRWESIAQAILEVTIPSGNIIILKGFKIQGVQYNNWIILLLSKVDNIKHQSLSISLNNLDWYWDFEWVVSRLQVST